MAELYWVPLALFMIGAGFLIHQRNARMGGALSICGILFFFGAELQSLYIAQAKQDSIQLLLFIKVFLSSLFFFFTRQYWFSWLRL
jgi:membrane-bound ClpP family serine protease